MAENSTHSASASRVAEADIGEDDPFAELTRIIGFDPREKVTRQEQSAESDLGLDLERELLGAFGDDDFVATSHQPLAAAPAPVEVTVPVQPVAAHEQGPSAYRQLVDSAHAITPATPSAIDMMIDEEDIAATDERALLSVEDLQFDEDAFEPAQSVVSEEPVNEAVLSASELDFSGFEDELAEAVGISAPSPVEAVAPEPIAALEPQPDDTFELDDAGLDLDPISAAEFEADFTAEMQLAEPELDDQEAIAADPLVESFEEIAQPDAHAAPKPWFNMLETVADQPVAQPEPMAEPIADDFYAEPELTDSLQNELLETLEFEEETQAAPDLAQEYAETAEFEAEFAAHLEQPEESYEAAPAMIAEPEPVASQPITNADSDGDSFELELADFLNAAEVQVAEIQSAAAEDETWFDSLELADSVSEPEMAYEPVTEVQAEAPIAEAVAPIEAAPVVEELIAAEPLVEEPVVDEIVEPEPEVVPVKRAAVGRSFADLIVSGPRIPRYPVQAKVAKPVEAPVAPVVPEPVIEQVMPALEASAADIDGLDELSESLFASFDAAFDGASQAEEAPEAVSDISMPAPLEAAAPFSQELHAHLQTTDKMEESAMQAFNEKAFDAALDDEFGLNQQAGRAQAQTQGYAQAHEYPLADLMNFARQQAAAPAPHVSQTHYQPDEWERPRANVTAPSMQPQAPEIETTEYVEERLSPTNDLELPEIEYGHDVAPAAFDDFDHEFGAAAYMQPQAQANAPHAAQAAQASPEFAGSPRSDQDYDFDQNLAAGFGATPSPLNDLSRAGMYEPQDAEDDYGYMPVRHQQKSGFAMSRNLLLGGVVAGLVAVGGIAVYAFSGGSSSDGPSILRADADPMKVRPENPGGTVVPNQDNVVYDRVGSGQPLASPTQERLITTNEQPVDLAAEEEAPYEDLSAFGYDSPEEDRLDADLNDGPAVAEETVAVAPRRVRTMIVRPDGTMVPRDDNEPAAAVAAPSALSLDDLTSEGNDNVASIERAPAPVSTPAPVPAPAPKPAPVAQAQPTQVAALPTPVPAAPAEAPVTAAVPGGWSIQIASQPTAAGAQSSYKDLAKRYGNVIGGKGVSIVKADIEGKGTYYRVRIPAPSRGEANTLCTSYKSAGGSCFVTQ